ncbi:hypothetical protein [Methylocystis rosea]|uniref:hypothetical protein n=1 Tax=Methylocystis rosea TaxID=173366 RepID=UPI00037EA4F0|nr:hypothetical protein [Methylocystis rosea]
MKLLDYLKLNEIADEAFAAEFDGEISASAVRKWKYGERNPRLPELVRIEEITNGAVTARDFLPDQPTQTDLTEAAS